MKKDTEVNCPDCDKLDIITIDSEEPPWHHVMCHGCGRLFVVRTQFLVRATTYKLMECVSTLSEPNVVTG